MSNQLSSLDQFICNQIQILAPPPQKKKVRWKIRARDKFFITQIASQDIIDQYGKDGFKKRDSDNNVEDELGSMSVKRCKQLYQKPPLFLS